MKGKTIIHMDMDAFFASVEELAKPSIRGKPVVVAGPGERSIITTASYPARKYGIRTGMSVAQAKKLCRRIVLIRADYRKYSDASKRVMTVLESFTSDVAAASVDEAFMDAGAIVGMYENPLHLGSEIKKRVKAETGLTCSVGIAENRLLAKLASGMKKPDGLTWIEPAMVKEVLEETPVERLCGIGPVTTRELNSMGIRTCGELGRYPEEILKGRFGASGKKLSAMGRGEGDGLWSRENTGDEKVKSIGHSVTLPRDLTDRPSMAKVLLTLSEMVGRRARRNTCCGKALTLTWRYHDFSTRTKRATMASPINLTEDIYRNAMQLFDTIEIQDPVRLLGLSLSDLTFGRVTGSLFPEEKKKEDVQKALDGINDRFGEFTLSYGDTIADLRSQKVISPAWRPRGIRKSV